MPCSYNLRSPTRQTGLPFVMNQIACSRSVIMKDMERQFTAVIEKKGRWYVAFVEEIPGVNTQGRTLAEARKNLKEALSLILETNRKLAARDRSPDARREPITLTI